MVKGILPSAEGVLAMSAKERDYAATMRQIKHRTISKAVAARQLNRSRSQIHRLYDRWEELGDGGLIHKSRGRQSNCLRVAEKEGFIEWYKGLSHIGRYAPKHASQMFYQDSGGTRISKESARCWLIEHNLWQAKSAKAPKVHPLRARRQRRGELVQIDGSEHIWLGEHKFVMLMFIDDATSEVLYAKFVKSENTFDYMRAFEAYIRIHGVPLSIYTDHHSVFYNNNNPELKTQFGEAMKALEVAMIPSSTPQSRGRVERSHSTTQERLVKELANRAGWTGGTLAQAIETANAYLPSWIDDYNRKFPVSPASEKNAHRPLSLSGKELQLIMSKHYRRKISANGSFSLEGKHYNIENIKILGRWRIKSGAFVDIYLHYSDTITVLCGDKKLYVRCVGEAKPEPVQTVDARQLNSRVDALIIGRKKAHIPPDSHPWKGASYQNRKGASL